MTVTIWHNPRCSKSRQTLELLNKKGVEPTIREYLKQPPSKAEVEKLIDMVGGDPGELLRDGEAEFKALGKKKAEMSKADIAKAVATHPGTLPPRRKRPSGSRSNTSLPRAARTA